MSIIEVKYNLLPSDDEESDYIVRATVKAHIDVDKLDEWIKRAEKIRQDYLDKNK